jgi:hypothetical protein
MSVAATDTPPPRGYVGYSASYGSAQVFAGGDHGLLDALAASGWNAFDVEDGQRHGGTAHP